jgi:hypothetical protein
MSSTQDATKTTGKLILRRADQMKSILKVLMLSDVQEDKSDSSVEALKACNDAKRIV